MKPIAWCSSHYYLTPKASPDAWPAEFLPEATSVHMKRAGQRTKKPCASLHAGKSQCVPRAEEKKD